MKLFTYGSLQRGHFNCNRMMSKEKFIRESTIQGNYVLFTKSGIRYPFLVDISLSTVFHPLLQPNIIQGEIWEVSEETMKRLEGMEMQAGYYPLTFVKDIIGEEVGVFLFKEHFLNLYKETVIIVQSGNWTEYIKRFKPELYHEPIELETVSLS